ncbi:hypothetical protein [Tahibacter amnicola]|uniref:LemA protein n=1 Tax=Tahibacter amnicola TaxID=2976241 RepID=A0ABY6BAI1_9GAMM|nr:hypothetical protein [Tahibacter amnicola]UXI67068.1 hypothetical protein N4264_20285 [Tahibacter amnicola]
MENSTFSQMSPESELLNYDFGRQMPSSLDEMIASLDKGWATLIAASLAALVSIVTLIVTAVVARSQARLNARLTDATNVSKEAREYKLKQLTSFYDPVYTLLAANKQIFERLGPKSSARLDQQFNDEETAEVWQKLSVEVVVPNNSRICEIIHTSLHYLADAGDEDLYLGFLTHAHAYKVFKQGAYEAYRLFQFPAGFFEAVERGRANLRDSLAASYRQSL